MQCMLGPGPIGAKTGSKLGGLRRGKLTGLWGCVGNGRGLEGRVDCVGEGSELSRPREWACEEDRLTGLWECMVGLGVAAS
jgi:hypothetical protein